LKHPPKEAVAEIPEGPAAVRNQGKGRLLQVAWHQSLLVVLKDLEEGH